MESKKLFIVNILYYGVILFFGYLGIKYLLPVLLPFLIAFLIVWVLKYPAGYLAGKWHCKRKWILIALLTVFYGSMLLLILKVGAGAMSALGNSLLQIPEIYTKQILPAFQKGYQHVSVFLAEINPDIVTELERSFEQILTELGTFLSESSGSIVKKLSAYAVSVPSVFVKVVITIISSYFIAGDYDHIIEFLFGILPDKWKSKVTKVTEQMKRVFVIFLRSYSLLMLLTFVELYVGLRILKIPYAAMVALAISIFDILPILGTGGILIPWAIIAGLIGNYRIAVGILVLYVIITAIRNTLEPRLVGKQIGLHPLATLVSMFIGVKLFGLIGLFGFPVALSIFVRMKKIDDAEIEVTV